MRIRSKESSLLRRQSPGNRNSGEIGKHTTEVAPQFLELACALETHAVSSAHRQLCECPLFNLSKLCFALWPYESNVTKIDYVALLPGLILTTSPT
jgi:hypothetical protein